MTNGRLPGICSTKQHQKVSIKVIMSKQLKVGVVGASANGGWSPVAHIPALKALENTQLAAICTSRPESAQAASDAFGVKRAYFNVNELVKQADLDIVSCVVKIPDHYEVVKAALLAEKHVYCEWPLGATLQETEELAKLANEKGVVTAIGLQGYRAPEILYLKHLVETGWFGKIVNVKMSMQTTASSERASRKAWEDEKRRMATLFSIVGGHTLFYISHIFGRFSEVSAQLTTQFDELTLKDNGEKVKNEVADQINIHGLISDGIPFISQISAVPHHSNGWRLEIYGTEGTVIATSQMLPQITPISLMRSQDDMELSPMSVPNDFVKFNYLPQGPASNVGRNYGSMADAIKSGKHFHPNFDDALDMHRLLKTIELSSLKKRTLKP